MKDFAAVVLAGGYSSRMGAFKPLLPLDGSTVAQWLISTLRQNGLPVVVVAGHRSHDLKDALAGADVRVVENPDFAAGMFSSVQAGLRALNNEFRGAFIAPVDIPLVRSFTLERLLEGAAQHPGKIIYPVFEGRRGHPPCLPAEIFPLILGRPQEGDLKSALQAAEVGAVEVAVVDRFIHADLDTPADYARLKVAFARREVPTPGECEAVLAELNPGRSRSPENRRRLLAHLRKVASVAEALGRAAIEAKVELDLEALVSAALLHDLAKGQDQHAHVGAALLERMGFGEIGRLVAAHQDLGSDPAALSLEAKVLYLADKLVFVEKVISLEERSAHSLWMYGDNPSAAENIRTRFEEAKRVKEEVESLTGRSLEKILS